VAGEQESKVDFGVRPLVLLVGRWTDPTKKLVDFTLCMKLDRTGEPQRDDHLRSSDFLDVGKQVGPSPRRRCGAGGRSEAGCGDVRGTVSQAVRVSGGKD